MRRNRIVTFAVIAVAAFAGGLTAQVLFGGIVRDAQASPAGQVLEATAFVVVDQQGREVARLGAAPDMAGLLVHDRQGKRRMVVGGLPEGQFGLVIQQPDGKTQLALGGWTETNHIDLYDGAGHPRFTVGVSKDGGGAGLAFYDREKKERLAIGMGPGGGGDFAMKNAGGETLWRASQHISHH
ncbi:MAG: hypothetical protein PVJ27_07290 [Candidatus Brocadiaceae bacterium]|jgi:hypothetical protein